MGAKALALLATTVLCGSFAEPATAGRLVTIDSFGLWTLERLGYGPVVFPVAGPLEFPEIPGYERRGVSRRYLLPGTARQGPRTWYLIHLHFKIVFSARSAPGRAYVTAETGAVPDLRASAQIIFKISRRDGKLWISSDSLGLVAGHRVREAPSRAWTLTFDNYIGYAGIKPGRNELKFGLEQTKGVRVERLVFFRDSGIRYSPYSPAQIRLSAKASARRLRVGKPFRIDTKIRNTGGRGVRDAVVLLRYDRDRLEPRGPDSKRIRVLRGTSDARASFSLVPRRPGEVEVDVEARAALSNPLVPLRLRVTGADRAARRSWPMVTAVAGGALFLLALASVSVLRRRG